MTEFLITGDLDEHGPNPPVLVYADEFQFVFVRPGQTEQQPLRFTSAADAIAMADRIAGPRVIVETENGIVVSTQKHPGKRIAER